MKRLSYAHPLTQIIPVEAMTNILLLGSDTAPEPGKQSQKKASPVF